jgi:hypothetical protein
MGRLSGTKRRREGIAMVTDPITWDSVGFKSSTTKGERQDYTVCQTWNVCSTTVTTDNLKQHRRSCRFGDETVKKTIICNAQVFLRTT